jgi:hypothetical protein
MDVFVSCLVLHLGNGHFVGLDGSPRFSWLCASGALSVLPPPTILIRCLPPTHFTIFQHKKPQETVTHFLRVLLSHSTRSARLEFEEHVTHPVNRSRRVLGRRFVAAISTHRAQRTILPSTLSKTFPFFLLTLISPPFVTLMNSKNNFIWSCEAEDLYLDYRNMPCTKIED